jgi:hypothetical protein
MKLLTKLFLFFSFLFALQGNCNESFAMQSSKNISIQANNTIKTKLKSKKVAWFFKQKKVKDFEFLNFIESKFLRYLLRLAIGLSFWGLALLFVGLIPITWLGVLLGLIAFYVGVLFIFGEGIADLIMRNALRNL